MLDTGKELSFDDAKKAVEGGNIIDFLKHKFSEIDLSLYVNDERTEAFNYLMKDTCEVLHNNERRKMGIQNNGLCLLIGYATEMVQRVLMD